MTATLDRWLPPFRALVGALELTLPRRALSSWVGQPVAPGAAGVIRVLGARQLLQAAVIELRPTSSVLVAGVAVDGLHAATMVALAIGKRSWRRAALGEAVLAVAFAAAGALVARSLSRSASAA